MIKGKLSRTYLNINFHGLVAVAHLDFTLH